MNKRPRFEKRLSILPVQDYELYQHFLTHRNAFWTVDEIDFAQDEKDWQQLSDKEKRALEIIMAFFAVSDAVVIDNIGVNFLNDLGQLRESSRVEAEYYYRYQQMIEQEHALTYSKMIEILIKDDQKRQKLFEALKHFPCIKQMIDWAEKWMNPDLPYSERLVAFVIYEGLFFSDKFAFIFLFKHKNKLPGLVHSNLLISADEGSHTKFGIMVHSRLEEKAPIKLIEEMMDEAIQVDNDFIEEVLEEDLVGLKCAEMKDYVKMVANGILHQFGSKKVYQHAINNITEMMESIGQDVKTNFFERRNHVYQKPEITEFAVDAL